jgi:hypothetical protein
VLSRKAETTAQYPSCNTSFKEHPMKSKKTLSMVSSIEEEHTSRGLFAVQDEEAQSASAR